MKSVIVTALIFAAPLASALENTKWNQLYYVYCGYESSDTYLTWYWRPERVERDLEKLKDACRQRNQSDKIIVVPSE